MFTEHGFCPTVYGPVRSRRHGVSLGINLGSVENKICTWGCIYCQCGMGERRDFKTQDVRPTAESVLELVRAALQKNKNIDCITFAGNSEPSAHPEFVRIVSELIALREALGGRWRLVALSNGSELSRPDVVQALEKLDEAWVKLDCATEDLFKRLNRSIGRVGLLSEHVERMKELKSLRIQTLVWSCSSQERLSNWTEENREGLAKLYDLLKPRVIHLITISRQPAVHSLEAVPHAELLVYRDRLVAAGVPVEVH